MDRMDLPPKYQTEKLDLREPERCRENKTQLLQ